jgi:radical SAM superfamily enzyme YgiQ (UPF0313 family)
MEEVVLIYPRFAYPSDYSIGLAHIASYLRESLPFNVSICDTTFNPSLSYVHDFLKKKMPFVVGIYASTIMLTDALMVAQIAKGLGAKVILGGPHPTVMPESVIKERAVDAICIGEGEIAFKEFVEATSKKGDYEGIKGIWWKRGEDVIKNPGSVPISDLDSLPNPAIDLYNVERYIDSFFQLDSYNPSLRGLPFIAGRGCPFSCTYCQPTLNTIFGKKIRIRSPENVVSEIKLLIDRYKIDSFYFHDDTFTIFHKWLVRFCELLTKEGIKLPFALNTRADTTDRDQLLMLKETGMVKLKVGIESISDRVRNGIYKKKVSEVQIKNLLSWCKELKIQVAGFFMLGAPTESSREVWKTILFATTSCLLEANFSVATPLPKTSLYDMAKENGWRLPENPAEFDYYQVKRPKMAKGEIGITFLWISKKIANIIFYLAPHRFLITLKQILKIKKFLMKLGRV